MLFRVSLQGCNAKLAKKKRAQRRKKLSKSNGRQREATNTEPKSRPQGPAGGKSNGRQREATALEPKAALQGPAGGISNRRQREATGGSVNGAEIDARGTNS